MGYDFRTDICKGHHEQRTNIQITFTDINTGNDGDISELVGQIQNALQVQNANSSEITLYLTFSQNSNPSYRAYPNVKRPVGAGGTAYSRLERQLLDAIFNKFRVHYIPSEKSVSQLYDSLITPFLAREIHSSTLDHVDKIQQALDRISENINQSLADAGLAQFTTHLSLPDSPEKIYRTINLNVNDKNLTSLYSKGMGIQSAVIFSAIKWISEKEAEIGKRSLWLIEEPESYLHPELAPNCRTIIKQLNDASQAIISTHSLAFVSDQPDQNLGFTIKDGWTSAQSFKTSHEATKRIRASLGIKFSDFYNLSRYNLFVEGQTDRLYLEHIVKLLRSDESMRLRYPSLTSDELTVHDFGGVKGLEGFLRATYEFVSAERAAVALLDGDDAGLKCRRDLQQFFGQKNIPFSANKDFVIVRDRFPVEGLLPDQWLRQLYQDHNGWFENFDEDAQGEILPFRVKDSHKTAYANKFISMAAMQNFDEWGGRFSPVLEAVERALAERDKIIISDN